jgi:hypothetical protein
LCYALLQPFYLYPFLLSSFSPVLSFTFFLFL